MLFLILIGMPKCRCCSQDWFPRELSESLCERKSVITYSQQLDEALFKDSQFLAVALESNLTRTNIT